MQECCDLFDEAVDNEPVSIADSANQKDTTKGNNKGDATPSPHATNSGRLLDNRRMRFTQTRRMERRRTERDATRSAAKAEPGSVEVRRAGQRQPTTDGEAANAAAAPGQPAAAGKSLRFRSETEGAGAANGHSMDHGADSSDADADEDADADAEWETTDSYSETDDE